MTPTRLTEVLDEYPTYTVCVCLHVDESLRSLIFSVDRERVKFMINNLDPDKDARIQLKPSILLDTQQKILALTEVQPNASACDEVRPGPR